MDHLVIKLHTQAVFMKAFKMKNNSCISNVLKQNKKQKQKTTERKKKQRKYWDYCGK